MIHSRRVFITADGAVDEFLPFLLPGQSFVDVDSGRLAWPSGTLPVVWVFVASGRRYS